MFQFKEAAVSEHYASATTTMMMMHVPFLPSSLSSCIRRPPSGALFLTLHPSVRVIRALSHHSPSRSIRSSRVEREFGGVTAAAAEEEAAREGGGILPCGKVRFAAWLHLPPDSKHRTSARSGKPVSPAAAARARFSVTIGHAFSALSFSNLDS